MLAELRADGALSAATRRRLARAAFAHTAAYDAAIVAWLDEIDPAADGLRPTLHLALERAQELRYGENPHQNGAPAYRGHRRSRSWWDDAVQHGGKELSYLNLYDAEAAWRLVHEPGRTPGGGGHQARQPLRRGGGRRPRRPPTGWPTSATRSPPSGASWRSTAP